MLEKCPCQYCQGSIEFELSEFVESGQDANWIFGQTVQCPHCEKGTILFIPKPASVKKEKPQKIDRSQNAAKRRESAWGLDVAAILLFLIGCGLILNGCAGELGEEANPEGSAIRQGVAALQYGFGFVVLTLSLILYALARLIRK